MVLIILSMAYNRLTMKIKNDDMKDVNKGLINNE